MTSAAGSAAEPAASVEYPSTFCRYCWLMYIVPINVPNTMMPATAATQKIRRRATFGSNSGLRARNWRITKASPDASAITSADTATVFIPSTGTKLIPSTSEPTRTTDISHRCGRRDRWTR